MSQLQWFQCSHAPEDDAGFARKSRIPSLPGSGKSHRFRALETDTRIYEFLTSNYFGFNYTRDGGIKE